LQGKNRGQTTFDVGQLNLGKSGLTPGFGGECMRAASQYLLMQILAKVLFNAANHG
jgi:hypothetical protein